MVSNGCINYISQSWERLPGFLKWAVNKQMTHEGGFQGRANKLVDSCYSFWQGAIFPLLHEAFRQSGADMKLPEEHCWFLDPCFRHFQEKMNLWGIPQMNNSHE
jgi:hypothetical protein